MKLSRVACLLVAFLIAARPRIERSSPANCFYQAGSGPKRSDGPSCDLAVPDSEANSWRSISRI